MADEMQAFEADVRAALGDRMRAASAGAEAVAWAAHELDWRHPDHAEVPLWTYRSAGRLVSGIVGGGEFYMPDAPEDSLLQSVISAMGQCGWTVTPPPSSPTTS